MLFIELYTNEQYMVIARVLWGFDITWPVNKGGQRIDQDIMPMVDGFMSTPSEFRATFTPRSAKRSKIFRDEWAGISFCNFWLIPSAAERRHQICASQRIHLTISIDYFWSLINSFSNIIIPLMPISYLPPIVSSFHRQRPARQKSS